MFEHWNSLLKQTAAASVSTKLIAFFAAWISLWLPIAIPLAIGLQWRPFQAASVQQKIPLVLSLYAIAPLVLWGAIYLENQLPAAYGIIWTAAALRSLIIGLSIGGLGVGLLFGLERSLGWIDWQPQGPLPVASTLALALIVSAIEESIFRGFLLSQLQQAVPTWLAAVLSSSIFALLHLVWQGRKAMPQLPGLWLMGAVLVLARAIDGGSLALAWGLHAGWVWAIAAVDAAQAVRYRDRAPTWAVGIDGQPLAGAIGLLLLLTTGGLVWLAKLVWTARLV